MPAVLSVQFVDAKGARASTQFNLQDGIDLAAMQVMAVAMLEAIDPLITGRIDNASIIVPVTGATIGDAVLSSADVEEGARFIFRTDNGFTTQVRIPTFNEAKFVTATQLVDLADLDVQAFVDLAVAGVDANGLYTDSRNDPIGELASARESFQRSRRLR